MTGQRIASSPPDHGQWFTSELTDSSLVDEQRVNPITVSVIQSNDSFPTVRSHQKGRFKRKRPPTSNAYGRRNRNAARQQTLLHISLCINEQILIDLGLGIENAGRASVRDANDGALRHAAIKQLGELEPRREVMRLARAGVHGHATPLPEADHIVKQYSGAAPGGRFDIAQAQLGLGADSLAVGLAGVMGRQLALPAGDDAGQAAFPVEGVGCADAIFIVDETLVDGNWLALEAVCADREGAVGDEGGEVCELRSGPFLLGLVDAGCCCAD